MRMLSNEQRLSQVNQDLAKLAIEKTKYETQLEIKQKELDEATAALISLGVTPETAKEELIKLDSVIAEKLAFMETSILKLKEALK